MGSDSAFGEPYYGDALRQDNEQKRRALAAARMEAEELLAALVGRYSSPVERDLSERLRDLLAALPDEGEAPALTGLEAALVGDRPAPRPSPTPEESRAALLALADAAPEPGTSFLAGGAPTRDSKLPPVTDDEAHEILSRFVASHFRKSDREHARFRIPADPAHDDDLRMAQYIEEARALRSRGISPEVEAAAEAVVSDDWWGHYCPSCGSTAKHGPECRIGRLAKALSSARAAKGGAE